MAAPLTAEQTRLVVDHFDYVKKLASFNYEDDEFEGVACETLVKAARTYRADSGWSFRTYLTVSVRRDLTDHYRHWTGYNRRTRTPLSVGPFDPDLHHTAATVDIAAAVAEKVDAERLLPLIDRRAVAAAALMDAGASWDETCTRLGYGNNGSIAYLYLTARKGHAKHRRTHP